MGWFGRNAHWIALACFVLSLFATAGVGVLALIAGLGSLGRVPFTEVGIIVGILKGALPYILPLFVLLALDVIFLVATVVAALRKASLPRHDRLSDLAERLERRYPALEILDFSDRVEPTNEDRRADLKQQYVDGEISEAEFERRVGTTIDDDEDPLLEEPADRNRDRNVEYE